MISETIDLLQWRVDLNLQEEAYHQSGLHRLLRKIDFVMGEALLVLWKRSLEEFTARIEDASCDRPMFIIRMRLDQIGFDHDPREILCKVYVFFCYTSCRPRHSQRFCLPTQPFLGGAKKWHVRNSAEFSTGQNGPYEILRTFLRAGTRPPPNLNSTQFHRGGGGGVTRCYVLVRETLPNLGRSSPNARISTGKRSSIGKHTLFQHPRLESFEDVLDVINIPSIEGAVVPYAGVGKPRMLLNESEVQVILRVCILRVEPQMLGTLGELNNARLILSPYLHLLDPIPESIDDDIEAFLKESQQTFHLKCDMPSYCCLFDLRSDEVVTELQNCIGGDPPDVELRRV